MVNPQGVVLESEAGQPLTLTGIFWGPLTLSYFHDGGRYVLAQYDKLARWREAGRFVFAREQAEQRSRDLYSGGYFTVPYIGSDDSDRFVARVTHIPDEEYSDELRKDLAVVHLDKLVLGRVQMPQSEHHGGYLSRTLFAFFSNRFSHFAMDVESGRSIEDLTELLLHAGTSPLFRVELDNVEIMNIYKP